MTRPRILSIGQVQEKSSYSKIWNVKKKLQQVSAQLVFLVPCNVMSIVSNELFCFI